MKPEECCCFACPELFNVDGPDCACDEAPVYDEEACTDCKYEYICDVPKNPSVYSYKKMKGGDE